jgi:TatD DNase family protein
MIDSHCHLADEVLVDDLDEVVARARAAGVAAAMCILSADEPEELTRAEVVRGAWPGLLVAAAIHPHRAGGYAGRPGEASRVTGAAVLSTHASAIGEIGLDYHYDFAGRDVQREVFGEQVALAVTRGLPIVVHTREATADTVAVLREAGQGRVRGVMHCFSGTIDEARLVLDLGFFVSLAGILTFPKAATVRDVGRFVPADRLLVETDAPFLAPVPHRGKRNEPAWVVRTFEALASVRGDGMAALDAQITDNFDRLIRHAA